MSNNPPVISVFTFSPELQRKLSEAAEAEVYCTTSKEDFLNRLHDAEIVCTLSLPKNWRELAPHLRWIQSPGAGIDNLASSGVLAPDSGVIVTTASGIHIHSISEYVFASMIMFNRSWPELVRLQDRHIWAHNTHEYHLRERVLAGKTLGLVGLGQIGRRIAQVGRAFGMQVLATRFSAHGNEQDPDVDQIYPLDHLHEMLGRSQYIVLAMPLTAKTEKMIGEAELRAMRPDTYLVNIARGRVIDEAALLRALQEGWIAGAGLDVTEKEPLPADSPLYTLPNVILTPHISGGNEEYAERLAELFSDNLRRYRSGQPLHNLYQPDRGY